jgi:dihydroneopterin aldolase
MHGGTFEVDIEMNCNLEKLNYSDNIKNTVDYLSVYKSVEKLFNSKKFNLIETASRRICEMILDNYENVMLVKVNVRKLNAALGIIDNVEAIYEAGRA